MFNGIKKFIINIMKSHQIKKDEKHLSLKDTRNLIEGISSIIDKLESENSTLKDFIYVVDDINNIEEMQKLNHVVKDISSRKNDSPTSEEQDLIFPYINIVHLDKYCYMMKEPNMKPENIETFKDMITLTLHKYRLDLRAYMLIHYDQWE